jgi:hypothetical protein
MTIDVAYDSAQTRGPMVSETVTKTTRARNKTFMRFTVNFWTTKIFLSFLSTFVLFLASIPVFGQVCWKIEQHCMPIGDCLVYLSPVALRIDALTIHITVLAKAPDWQVNYFNKDNHLLATIPLRNWHGAPVSRTVELWYETNPSYKWISTGPVTYRKFACEYSMNSPRTFTSASFTEKLSPEQMWRSTQIKLSPEQGAIFSQFFGFPRFANRIEKKSDGMPFFLMLRTSRNVPSEFLRTQSCKQVTQANIFDLPKGLKSVASDIQVEADKPGFFMPFKP